MKIILASSSLGRKKILESLGLKFEIIPSNIDEDKFTAPSPLALVKKIAKAKAMAVLRAISEKRKATSKKLLPIPYSLFAGPYVIIAADSMILFRGQIYGKPKTKTEAKKFLKMFSGKTHRFLTGLCVIDTTTAKLYQTSCYSRVYFSKLMGKEIDDYVKTANVTSFAGGYAPDLPGGEIIKAKMKIIGSKSNVLGGLPLEKLLPVMKRFLPERK